MGRGRGGGGREGSREEGWYQNDLHFGWFQLPLGSLDAQAPETSQALFLTTYSGQPKTAPYMSQGIRW